MKNFYQENEDLQWYVNKGIDWKSIVEVVEMDYKALDGFENQTEATDFYKEILSMVGQLAADEIAPAAADIEEKGMKYKGGEVQAPEELLRIFEKMKEMGLHSMVLPRELGGMNCPFLLYFLNAEMIGRADAGVMNHYGFHGGIMLALLMYSLYEGSTEYQTEPPRLIKTRFEEAIKDIASGNSWGSMDITEPDCGSDMGAMRTYAEQNEKGEWFVTGQKIFITSGHGKHHIVIARTEGDDGDSFDGLKKMSLFYVPAWTEDENGVKTRHITVDGLEKKMGISASATVTVNYEKSPGHLLGKRGDGFKLMLLIMNNARISVGFEALGVCEAAYRKAREYAGIRSSMGKTIDQHEMIYDYLDEMKTDIQGIRALAVHSGFHEEMTHRCEIIARLLPDGDPRKIEAEKRKKFHAKKSRAVTPLLKYIASEKSVEIAYRGVQIHGGMGYIRETGAEKLMRDAVIFPIYEGTSQIQSLMAMKDAMMEIIKEPQVFMQRMLTARARSIVNNNDLSRRVAKIQVSTFKTLQHLVTKVAAMKITGLKDIPFEEWVGNLTSNWDPKKDFAPAMLHAERLMIMLTDKAICEVLLKQVKEHPEREDVLLRYLERAEPRVEDMYNRIMTTGDRLLRELDEMESNKEQVAV